MRNPGRVIVFFVFIISIGLFDLFVTMIGRYSSGTIAVVITSNVGLFVIIIVGALLEYRWKKREK